MVPIRLKNSITGQKANSMTLNQCKMRLAEETTLKRLYQSSSKNKQQIEEDLDVVNSGRKTFKNLFKSAAGKQIEAQNLK